MPRRDWIIHNFRIIQNGAMVTEPIANVPFFIRASFSPNAAIGLIIYASDPVGGLQQVMPTLGGDEFEVQMTLPTGTGYLLECFLEFGGWIYAHVHCEFDVINQVNPPSAPPIPLRLPIQQEAYQAADVTGGAEAPYEKEKTAAKAKGKRRGKK